MNPHVLITTTSAPSGPGATSAPDAASRASSRSLSTVFLSQPSVTSPIRTPAPPAPRCGASVTDTERGLPAASTGVPDAGPLPCGRAGSTGRLRLSTRLFITLVQGIVHAARGELYRRRPRGSTSGRPAPDASAPVHDPCTRRRRESEQVIVQPRVDPQVPELESARIAVRFHDLEAPDQMVGRVHPDAELPV